MKPTALLVALATLAGCGSAGSFNGTVAGNQLAVRDAIFGVTRDSAGKPTTAVLVLADVPDICTTVKANRNPKGATYVSVVLTRVSGLTLGPPDVGDYTVAAFPSSGNAAIGGTFIKNDPSCLNTVAGQSATFKSGLIKIANYRAEAGGGMSGTFDLTIGNQADKITGGFNAHFCDGWVPGTPASCE